MPNHLSQKLKIGVGWPSAVLLSVYIDEMVLFQGFLNVEIPVMPAVAAVDLPRDDYFRCPFDGWSQVPLTRVQVLHSSYLLHTSSRTAWNLTQYALWTFHRKGGTGGGSNRGIFRVVVTE